MQFQTTNAPGAKFGSCYENGKWILKLVKGPQTYYEHPHKTTAIATMIAFVGICYYS